jgi:hypothetical protein
MALWLGDIQAADLREWPTNMGRERVRYVFQKALLIKMQSADIMLIIEGHDDKKVGIHGARRSILNPLKSTDFTLRQWVIWPVWPHPLRRPVGTSLPNHARVISYLHIEWRQSSC